MGRYEKSACEKLERRVRNMKLKGLQMKADDCWFKCHLQRKNTESSLIREFVNKQGGRTGLVTTPVISGRVQISLGVAGVVGTPQRHRGTGDGNLHNTHKILFVLPTVNYTCKTQRRQNHKQSDRLSAFYLKDIRFVDEAHEGQEAAVRPPVDGDSTQVHKLVLVGNVVQPFHLVLDLHLTLSAGGGTRVKSPGKTVNVYHLFKGPVCKIFKRPP